MAAYERNWSFSTNNRFYPTSNDNLMHWQLWNFVATLTGLVGGFTGPGLWSCYYSCDSVTAGTASDGVNRWGGATLDETKLVRAAAAGTAHSWLVLKSPAMNGINWYVLLDYIGGGNQFINAYYGKSAPTGGTTLNAPTMADALLFHTDARWNAGTALPAVWYAHFGLTSTGDFYCLHTKAAGSASPVQAFLFIAPVGVHTSDLYPVYAYRHYDESGPTGTALNPNLLFSPGTAIPNKLSNGSSGFAYFPLGTPTTMISVWPDALTNRFLTLPAYLYVMLSGGANLWHARGRLPDFFLATGSGGGSAAAIGACLYDEVGNITHCNIGGGLWFPTATIPLF